MGGRGWGGIVRQSIVWQSNDQRHMHGGVVDKESVRLFAMLSQAFTVVAAQHDHRVLINPFLFQEPEKPADLFIRESDLAVVRLRRVVATVRLGRTIRKVRVVEMHPEEKLLL